MSEDTVLVTVDAAVATVTPNRGADRWEDAGVSPHLDTLVST